MFSFLFLSFPLEGKPRRMRAPRGRYSAPFSFLFFPFPFFFAFEKVEERKIGGSGDVIRTALAFFLYFSFSPDRSRRRKAVRAGRSAPPLLFLPPFLPLPPFPASPAIRSRTFFSFPPPFPLPLPPSRGKKRRADRAALPFPPSLSFLFFFFKTKESKRLGGAGYSFLLSPPLFTFRGSDRFAIGEPLSYSPSLSSSYFLSPLSLPLLLNEECTKGIAKDQRLFLFSLSPPFSFC